MGGHRQLTYLVEEEGALIGNAEIAGRIVDGASKRAFDVAEELTVDSTLGDGAAVDGEVFLASTGGVVMDESGQDVLTHTTFTDDEHTDIYRRNLQGVVKRAIQGLAIAYNIIALFDAL